MFSVFPESFCGKTEFPRKPKYVEIWTSHHISPASSSSSRSTICHNTQQTNDKIFQACAILHAWRYYVNY